MKETVISNPANIVDASHGNSIDSDGKKNPLMQPSVVEAVIKMNLDFVKGFMVESFLKTGNQKLSSADSIDMEGLSVTDACIGIDETRAMIEKIYNIL